MPNNCYTTLSLTKSSLVLFTKTVCSIICENIWYKYLLFAVRRTRLYSRRKIWPASAWRFQWCCRHRRWSRSVNWLDPEMKFQEISLSGCRYDVAVLCVDCMRVTEAFHYTILPFCTTKRLSYYGIAGYYQCKKLVIVQTWPLLSNVKT